MLPIWVSLKCTADVDCSHEIKRLGREAMTNLDSVLKSRDITLLTKICVVKATVFPAVTCRHESWTIKKAECQRIDAFELWCWRRLLRVPWKARRSNQSILKEVNPEYSLEGLNWSWNANTLAVWCEELTYWNRLWCWERLKAGEGDSMDMSLSKLQELEMDREAWRAAVNGITKRLMELSNWTELNIFAGFSSQLCTR